MIVLDIDSGERLQLYDIRIVHFPRCCGNLPNSVWVVIACVEKRCRCDGCLYKLEKETRWKVEFVIANCVEALLLGL